MESLAKEGPKLLAGILVLACMLDLFLPTALTLFIAPGLMRPSGPLPEPPPVQVGPSCAPLPCLQTLPTPVDCAPRDPTQGGGAFGAALLRLPCHSRVLCGAPKQSGPSLFRQGAVWIYGDGPAGLAAVGVLTSPTPSSGDQFGRALAGDGGWVAVGSPFQSGGSSHSGAVHIYQEKSQGFKHTQVLAPQDAGLLAFFGDAMHMQGPHLIVGAPRQMGAAGAFLQGAAWIYRLRGSTWEPQLRFDPPDQCPGARAGAAVLITPDTAFVGVPDHDGAAGLACGGVWMLKLQEGRWQAMEFLNSPQPRSNSHFGASLASSGNWLAVGAPGPETAGAGFGSVHLFRLGAAGPVHHCVVRAPSREAGGFGRALAPCQNGFLVGAPGGIGSVLRLEISASGPRVQCLLIGDAASHAGAAVQEGLLPGSFLAGEPGGTSSTSLAARRGGLLHLDPGIMPSPQVGIGDLTLGLQVCGDRSLHAWTSPVESSSTWRLLAVPSSGGPALVIQTGNASQDGYVEVHGTLGILPAGAWDLHLELVLLGGQGGSSDVHRVVLP